MCMPVFCAECAVQPLTLSCTGIFSHHLFPSALPVLTGRTTPCEVAERVIDFITRVEALPSQCKWLLAWSPDDIRRQAAASTKRWQAGTPLSALDGTPFSVKDFVDALPYPTTAGTTFIAGM